MPQVTDSQDSEQEKSISSLEKALIASEIRYRRLFESAKDGILILDAETGKIIDVNPFLINLLGYSKEKFIQKTIWEIGCLKDIVQNKDKFLELRQNGFVRSENLPLETADGRRIHVEFVSNVYLEDNKKVIQCNIRDITEHRYMEKKVFESEEQFMVITENSADAIFIIDEEGKYLYVNKQVVNLLGYSKEEMLKFAISDISPANKIDEYFQGFQRLFAEGSSYTEIELVKKDGRHVLTDVNAVLLPNDLIYASCRDITYRKRAEEEVRESEEKFRMIFEKAFDGISIYSDDPDSAKRRLVECNEQYANMAGRSRDELLQLGNIRVLQIADDDKLNSNRMDSMKSGKEYYGSYSWIRPDGKENIIEYVGKPVIWKGEPYTIGIDRDVTEQKRIEKELIKAKEKAEESDRLKLAFLANMGHEIRTPMNGILGFTSLLKEPKLTDWERQEFIDIIEKSGARMLNVINDIINISSIESGQIELSVSDVNINELARDIFNFFKPEAEKKELNFSYKNILSVSEVITKTDKGKVYAVLTNLVKNALKFTQTGSIELGYERKGQFFEFFVKDTGLGIPQDQEKIIFERFRQGSESLTRNYEGSGLGLAISKAYVEMLGGKIWMDRNKEKGSTFRFTIPFLNGSEENEQLIVIPKEEIRLPAKLKILIVEDDETSRMLLEIMIKPLTSVFFQANTGIEAIDKCSKNPDIDLVLMDIQMPGMNGYEATRQIRKFNKDVVIIAQTAYALPSDREKALEAGCNDHISKPVIRATLIKMIKKHLRPVNV